MSQINTLTVNDGATTPVARKFDVADRDGTRSTFRTSDAALIQGQAVIMHRADVAQNSRAANSVRQTIVYPIEGIENGVTKVLGTATATINLNYWSGMTAAQRQAFEGLVRNYQSNPDVKAQNIAVQPLS